jgi:hypothetical protein
LEKIVSFCGRVLTASELSLVRQIIADFPRLSLAELAAFSHRGTSKKPPFMA